MVITNFFTYCTDFVRDALRVAIAFISVIWPGRDSTPAQRVAQESVEYRIKFSNYRTGNLLILCNLWSLIIPQFELVTYKKNYNKE